MRATQPAPNSTPGPASLPGRLKELERENRELRRANEILRKASAYLSTFGRQQHRHSRASSSAVRPVRASSTLWRRKAGGYGGLDFAIVDTSSPKGQGSTKSGQLHTNALRAVVLNWLDEDECPPRIILCTPSKSIEAWVLAAVWPENNVVRRGDWECHRNPEGQLAALPKRRRFKKRPDDYRRRQSEIKKAWPQVSARLTEAARFEAEFLATIETVTAGRIRCEARDPQP